MNRFKRAMSVIGGTLSLGIGLVGIVLPLLPTTPFFLLTLFLYTHGSERFRKWFVSTKLYEIHLKDYIDNRQMSVAVKTKILIFATITLSLGIYFMTILPLRILLGVILLLHYYGIIFKIDTTKNSNKDDLDD